MYTREYTGLQYGCTLCPEVACEDFGACGTRSRVVHEVGFWGGPKFLGQCVSPEPLGHGTTRQCKGNLTYMYGCMSKETKSSSCEELPGNAGEHSRGTLQVKLWFVEAEVRQKENARRNRSSLEAAPDLIGRPT